MVKNHLKTLAVPKTWPVNRRMKTFVTKPDSGPHRLGFSVPLNFILRDILKHADTNKEVKKILQNNKVLVDGKQRKSTRFPVGIFDTFRIDETKTFFRIILNGKGKIDLVAIKGEESKIKPCKITGKTILRNAKTQINLYDGKSIIVDKDVYKVGDSVLLSLPEAGIKKHLKLEKNAVVFFIGGKHIGKVGIVEDIKGNKIIYKIIV